MVERPEPPPEALYSRDAPAKVLRDSENFAEVILALERFGSFRRPRANDLKEYRKSIQDVAAASSLAEDIPTALPAWHIPFTRLYEVVHERRNRAAHEGTYARHPAAPREADLDLKKGVLGNIETPPFERDEEAKVCRDRKGNPEDEVCRPNPGLSQGGTGGIAERTTGDPLPITKGTGGIRAEGGANRPGARRDLCQLKDGGASPSRVFAFKASKGSSRPHTRSPPWSAKCAGWAMRDPVYRALRGAASRSM